MKYTGLSDKGLKRTENQDRFVLCSKEDDRIVFACVCDGMGGTNGGELASSLAAKALREEYDKNTNEYVRHLPWESFLRTAALKANESVYNAALKDMSLYGMGTTLVAAVCMEDRALIANVGDSRAYLVTMDGISQITKDHSLINQMIESGEISPQEAIQHPNKNVITRALGVEKQVVCDLFETEVKHGEYILLCSDGLTNEVTEPEIHFEICNAADIESACRALIRLANIRGGHDNITVILVAF